MARNVHPEPAELQTTKYSTNKEQDPAKQLSAGTISKFHAVRNPYPNAFNKYTANKKKIKE